MPFDRLTQSRLQQLLKGGGFDKLQQLGEGYITAGTDLEGSTGLLDFGAERVRDPKRQAHAMASAAQFKAATGLDISQFYKPAANTGLWGRGEEAEQAKAGGAINLARFAMGTPDSAYWRHLAPGRF